MEEPASKPVETAQLSPKIEQIPLEVCTESSKVQEKSTYAKDF